MKFLHYLSGAGSANNATIARQADCKDQAGDHSFFKMSKQISPVYKVETLSYIIFQIVTIMTLKLPQT